MEGPRHPRKDGVPQPKYHNPPPVTVPRSQYANAIRPGTYRSNPSNTGPKYFSSPLRAPLNQQERHDSLVEHQKLFSNKPNSDRSILKSRYSPAAYKSSISTFEDHSATDTAPVTEGPYRALPSNGRANGVSESSQDQHGVVRQASIDHKAKPSLLEVKRSDSTRANKVNIEPKTPPLQTTTIEALNAAIVAASRDIAHETNRYQPSRNSSNVLAGPDSPTSTYSQEMHNQRKSQMRSSHAMRDVSRAPSLGSGLQTPKHTQDDRLSPLQGPTPHSEKSSSSTNPLLGLGIEHHGMSSRIPEEMRPPRLNIKAVRDMESRGSITSLPDLIRRATRLAANLDRGKTASRLGLWDMFGNTDHVNVKGSSFSDVLDAFPDPASGTSSKGVRPKSVWPSDPRDAITVVEKHESQPRKRKKRRCCGLSVTMFIVVLVVAILLTAAAVLIPIFLIAVPRQHRGMDLRNCATIKPCQNNAISIVDNNACSCVCVDGFTGNDCSKPTDPNCVTATILDGSTRFENATLGSAIVSLLQEAQGKMNIPLNATVLLSVFSSNNLSCASENSLVQFDTDVKRKQQRFVIIPSLEQHSLVAAGLDAPVPTSGMISTTTSGILAPRQTGAETVNNIVYQPSLTQTSATTSAFKDTSSITSSASPSATVLPTAKGNVTSGQLEFARLVVLYVLAGSRVPSTAVLAQQNIVQYFRAGALASGNSTVDIVKMGNIDITANFAELAIILSDGKIVGGPSLSG